MHVSAGDSGVRVRQRADTQGHHPQTLWLPSLMRLSATLGRDQPKSVWHSVCRRDRAILDLPLAP